MPKPVLWKSLILSFSTSPEMRRLLAILFWIPALAIGQELPSVAKMPDLPPNYKMRDWKQTAKNFDALVFDLDRKGDFLPLTWPDTSQRVNDVEGFGMPSYVGDSRQHPESNEYEAITGIAAVLGATLAGIDKSAFAPKVAVHYHAKDGIGLYLNQAGTVGDSFWYDLLPSLLFYHVYGHYRNVPGFKHQFVSTAEVWRKVSFQLDGNFDHTGFNFLDKRPVDRGWKEADAVAGIACIQYLAGAVTGDQRFLDVAEDCLDWMDARKVNPYYECLVPYGAYASARSNAERGTSHKTGKFIEWVLTGDNPRKWGAILESWNGTPVHGLVGSVYPDYEYAFAMNSFQAVGILAPIARYEDQYARDLAKWILNVAANGRYFYPDAWPAEQQSSYGWANRYDPDFCIPYEGIRKQGMTRNYPEEDHMVAGQLQLGLSSDPDKDMHLTADDKGRIRYEGIIEVPPGSSHSLIAGVLNRKVENDTRVFLAADESNAIQFRGQRGDVQRTAVQASGKTKVCLDAEGLKPGEVLKVKDIVIETRFANPPHVGGDPTVHGWGKTDLGLYGGAYAGFLAALVEPTNVPAILAIDPVATEVLAPDAYPTRLFFNPHPETRCVEWNVGDEEVRVYDALANQVLSESAKGIQTFHIPPKEAVMLVFTPADHPLETLDSQLVCDGIVVDYNR